MSQSDYHDVIVVGAGIVGLAHAYHLVKRGQRVLVLERDQRAVGASVRNFGMVWPIGQPAGEMREIALRSRAHWVQMLQETGLWHRECGSLHLAYHDDELAVLEEFSDKGASLGYDTSILNKPQTLEKCSTLVRNGLKGALWSATEVCVNPRDVVRNLPTWLAEQGAEFRYGVEVAEVGSGYVVASGTRIEAGRILLCTGDRFEALYPELFAASGLTRTRLQMMKARFRSSTDLGTHLCAGLTLGHYANFQICERLPALLERYHFDWPEQMKWGIHLLVSQHGDGTLTIGDSHEYGLAVEPFLREEINASILKYLATFLPIEEIDVIERWFGVYAKHPSKGYIIEEPDPGVQIVNGVGGAGMTLSFGVADKVVREW